VVLSGKMDTAQSAATVGAVVMSHSRSTSFVHRIF
jgi:hypothetical protein